MCVLVPIAGKPVITKGGGGGLRDALATTCFAFGGCREARPLDEGTRPQERKNVHFIRRKHPQLSAWVLLSRWSQSKEMSELCFFCLGDSAKLVRG